MGHFHKLQLDVTVYFDNAPRASFTLYYFEGVEVPLWETEAKLSYPFSSLSLPPFLPCIYTYT